MLPHSCQDLYPVSSENVSLETRANFTRIILQPFNPEFIFGSSFQTVLPMPVTLEGSRSFIALGQGGEEERLGLWDFCSQELICVLQPGPGIC